MIMLHVDEEMVKHPSSSRFSDSGQNELFSPFITHNSLMESDEKHIEPSRYKPNKVRTAGNSPAMSPGMPLTILNLKYSGS